MLLDATAGNRMMWMHNGKASSHIVFMDKEPRLAIPPDILAVWGHLPFRDKIFGCVIFDPPHMRLGHNSMWRSPQGGTAHGTWFGFVKNKRDLMINLIRAQIEFGRVANRLCFKWCEVHYQLEEVLKCFVDWKEIYRKQVESKRRSPQRAKKAKTWWITFIRKDGGKEE